MKCKETRLTPLSPADEIRALLWRLEDLVPEIPTEELPYVLYRLHQTTNNVTFAASEGGIAQRERLARAA